MGKGPKIDIDLMVSHFLRDAENFLIDAQKKVDALADKGEDCGFNSLADAVNQISAMITECNEKVLPTKTPRGGTDDETASAVSAANFLDSKIRDNTKFENRYETVDQRNQSFIKPGDLDRTVGFPIRFFKPSFTGAALSMGGISLSITGISAKLIGNYDSLAFAAFTKSVSSSGSVVNEIAKTTTAVGEVLDAIVTDAGVAEVEVGADKTKTNAITTQIEAVKQVKASLSLKV